MPFDFANVSRLDPYESDKPVDKAPTLEQVVEKAVIISEEWGYSRHDPEFTRHLSVGPLQLSEAGVHRFKDFVAKGDGLSKEEVRDGVLRLMIDDMLISSMRSGVAEKWQYDMDLAAQRDGTFAFSKEVVEELKRNESPVEVEQLAGEGWTDKDWAVKFSSQGFNVSDVTLEDRIKAEVGRLVESAVAYRAEIERAFNEGGRSEAQSSTNGGSLPSVAPELGRITYVGGEVDHRDDYWRKVLYLPGEEVRLMDISGQGLDMGEFKERFHDNVLKISETIVTRVDGVTLQPEYRFEGYDGSYPAVVFDHPNGVIFEIGTMTTRDEKVWFVPLDDFDGKPKGPAREVVGLEGRRASDFVTQGFEQFRKELTDDPSSGEFLVVPTDRKNESSSVRIAGIPWMSGASKKEVKIANRAIDEAIAARSNERSEAVRVMASLSKGPETALPVPPGRSLER